MISKIFISCLVFTFFLSGCSSAPESLMVPKELHSQVNLFDNERIRYWGDSDEGIWDVIEYMREKRSFEGKEFNFLALSGGGGNGAFSSGILNAWTDSGARPQFDSTTGISTGAIVAVFAYLGSEYDDVLTELYTETTEQDIYTKNSVFSIFSRNALFDTTPFQKKLRKTITPDVIKKVAEEYKKGRLLHIGTTHLESQRLTIWNMGEIALTGGAKAEKLFEDVILASAAIPGAFPPILIEVEVDGQTYHEVHVDGGLSRQVFFYNDVMTYDGDWTNGNAKSNMYVITNGEFYPQWKTTELDLVYLVRRSIATLLKYQGRSDVLRI